MLLSEVYSKKVDSCIQAIGHLKCDLQRMMQKYEGEHFDGGPEKSICFARIIEKQLDDDTRDYLNQRCNLPHLRNGRPAYEYGIDLMLGWLIEDAVLLVLEERGRRPVLSGHDRYREFLTPRKISTQPDIRVEFASGARLLEVFADWKGTWRSKNHADLRDNKYAKVKREQAVMLGIAPITAEGFLIDFAKDDLFEPSYIGGYRKMGYTFKGVRTVLMPLEKVIDDLLSL